jgi:hypothetical protein
MFFIDFYLNLAWRLALDISPEHQGSNEEARGGEHAEAGNGHGLVCVCY